MNQKSQTSTKSTADHAMQTPLLTPSVVSAVSHMRVPLLENWVTRSIIPLAAPATGRGKTRLWTMTECMTAAVLARFVEFSLMPGTVKPAAEIIAKELLANLLAVGLKGIPGSDQVYYFTKFGDADTTMACASRTPVGLPACAFRVDIGLLEKSLLRPAVFHFRHALLMMYPELHELLEPVLYEW